METLIDQLLANLNSYDTLKSLACYTDQAIDIGEINFRIGYSDGPEIKFRREVDVQFNIDIYNEQRELTYYPTLFGDAKFMICTEIANKINRLNGDEEYRRRKDIRDKYFVTSLINIIKPIFDFLEDENNKKKQNP